MRFPLRGIRHTLFESQHTTDYKIYESRRKHSRAQDGGATRREFLKKSTLAAAAVAASTNIFKTPVYGQDQAPAPGSVVGANNRLQVAYIGTGGAGDGARQHPEGECRRQ